MHEILPWQRIAEEICGHQTNAANSALNRDKNDHISKNNNRKKPPGMARHKIEGEM